MYNKHHHTPTAISVIVFIQKDDFKSVSTNNLTV